MATNPHIKVYINGELLRKYGGSRSKVRDMKLKYDRASREDIVHMHPNLAAIKGPIYVVTEYYTARHTLPTHAKNIVKHRA